MHKTTQYQLLAKEYWEEIGFTSIPSKDHEALTMSGELIVNSHSFNIIVSIDHSFPLTYPKFFINNQNWFLKYPHVERATSLGNNLCIIEEKAKRFHSNINELLFEQKKRLETFLKDLTENKLDKKEIFDEFESYWKTSNRTVCVYPEYLQKSGVYTSYLCNKLYYLVDEYEHLIQFFKACETSYREQKFLYLELGDTFTETVPQTYQDLLNVVIKSGHQNILESLSQDKSLSNLMVFSFIMPDSSKFFAGIEIEHPTSMKTKKYGYYQIFSNKILSNNKLKGITIDQIHNNRIFSRGGNEMSYKMSFIDKTVAIVGCGSVGASLAYKLLKSGVTNLTLIDNQLLSVDNIGRHLLGQEYVAQSKATATKNYLEKQFINCNIQAIPARVENNIDVLEKADLIITALGNDAPVVEEYILQQSITNELPPAISVWLEANALAGHAVFVNQVAYKSINNAEDQLAILTDEYAATLEKRDIGCNSTYMPYTFIDADTHVNYFAKMIIGYLLGKPVKPILTSVGDISNLDKIHLRKINATENTIMTSMAFENLSI